MTLPDRMMVWVIMVCLVLQTLWAGLGLGVYFNGNYAQKDLVRVECVANRLDAPVLRFCLEQGYLTERMLRRIKAVGSR